MIIDKQAFFVVKIAKNVEKKPAQERQAIMDSLTPKTRTLVNQARAIFAGKRKETHA